MSHVLSGRERRPWKVVEGWRPWMPQAGRSGADCVIGAASQPCDTRRSSSATSQRHHPSSRSLHLASPDSATFVRASSRLRFLCRALHTAPARHNSAPPRHNVICLIATPCDAGHHHNRRSQAGEEKIICRGPCESSQESHDGKLLTPGAVVCSRPRCRLHSCLCLILSVVCCQLTAHAFVQGKNADR